MAWFFFNSTYLFHGTRKMCFLGHSKQEKFKKNFKKVQQEIQKNSCLIQNKRIKDKLNKFL